MISQWNLKGCHREETTRDHSHGKGKDREMIRLPCHSPSVLPKSMEEGNTHGIQRGMIYLSEI